MPVNIVQAKLSPLQPAFRMDPVEKALRMGGVREEAKKLEEDGGTIAGMPGFVLLAGRAGGGAVEQLLQMGGVTEEAKKLEEDGGTIAGMG